MSVFGIVWRLAGLGSVAFSFCAGQEKVIPPVANWQVPQFWTPAASHARFSAETQPSTPLSSVLTYVAITPCRLLDTRSGQGFTGAFGPPALSPFVARTIPIPSQSRCSIPLAPAYSLNFTVVPQGPVSFLSAYPDDKPFPGTSILNDTTAGGVIANFAIIPSGSDGGISVVAGNATDLIVDINGYFVSSAIGLTLPFSGSSSFAGNTFAIQNTNNTGNNDDPTQSFAAIVGDGGFSQASVPGTNAGNTGVLGEGGPGQSIFATVAGSGGIGLFGKGGHAGDSKAGGAGVSGGAGVYAIGGTSGLGLSGTVGGTGVQAFGGVGGTACVYNFNTGVCDPQTTSGGAGGIGVIATGGTGGPSGASGIGLYAFPGTPGSGGVNNNVAAVFFGNVTVTGTLSKGAGSFRIDHPQDPAGKYLSHSFVESPDMMNVYNGNIVLDASGSAWVDLPGWFEDLNRDFRYQLTAIGAPAPGLYIAEEVCRNRFKIAGGKSGGRVSWAVTGIRKDPYANAHRIPVEEIKPAAERGTYLNPELYGQPEGRNVIYVQHPELRRRKTTEEENR